MAAFNFPDSPSNGLIVKNEATGVSYKFDSSSQTWVVVSTDVTTLYATEIELTAEVVARQAGDAELETYNSAQDARLNVLEAVDHSEQITYQIQTDKILRSADPAIELVDSAGFYSNVKFQGTGGIAVSSDLQSIIIDASNLEVDVDLSDIEADIAELQQVVGGGLTDQDLIQNQLDLLSTQRGAERIYIIKGVEFNIASRDGEMYIDAPEAANIGAATLAVRDKDGNQLPPVAVGDIVDFDLSGVVNRYKVKAGSGEVLELDYQSGTSTFSVDDEVSIYIYPQNSTSASKDYVDAQDELKLNLVGGELSGQIEIKSYTADGHPSLMLYPTGSNTATSDVFQVRNTLGQVVFRTTIEGATSVAANWTPTSDQHLVPKKYVDNYLHKEGGVITGELHFDRGEGGGNMMIYPNIGTADTVIYALNNSTLRFRTVAGDNPDSGERKTHISISKDLVTSEPVTNIYHLVDPTSDTHGANKRYVDAAVAGVASALNIEDTEPDIHYGDYPPTGTRTNGELWFDSMNLRLNVYSQGAWINPDRNDGATLENRLTLLETRLAQLEGN